MVLRATSEGTFFRLQQMRKSCGEATQKATERDSPRPHTARNAEMLGPAATVVSTKTVK
jgi:hypothetical protein